MPKANPERPCHLSDEQHLRLVAVLYRLSQIADQASDSQQALALILEQITAALDVSSASISLINPDSGELEIDAHMGFPADYPYQSLPLGIGITGWVALHAQSLHVADVSTDHRYLRLRPEVRCEMAVPMILAGNVIGVVNVDHDVVDSFTEADLLTLEQLTAEATKVIHRLWLVEQLEVKAEQLQSLISTGKALIGKRTTEQVLNQITEEAQQLMHCKACAIFLHEADNGLLKLKALSGYNHPAPLHHYLEIDASVVAVALQRKKQVAVYDLNRTEQHHTLPHHPQHELASLLVTPIVYEEQVIGVLNAYTDKPHRFNNDEKRVFAALAGMGAVAIQNARLYSKVFTTEENLRKNERLATLGLISAEIAHEVRNPLTVIRLLFDSLNPEYPASDPRAQDAHLIREKFDQLDTIVERVLHFSGNKQSTHVQCPVDPLIVETLHLVRLKLEQNQVHIHYHPAPTALTIEADKGQIQQVLLNLILNAIESMPSGGTIELTVSSENNGSGLRAIIRIADSGQGIPAAIQNNIFDSFLSARTGGTGLGLAIVKQILKAHHGDIVLEQSSPSGTTFKLSIPAAHDCLSPA